MSTYNDYVKGQEDQSASAALNSTCVPRLEPNDNHVPIKQMFVEPLHSGEQKQV